MVLSFISYTICMFQILMSPYMAGSYWMSSITPCTSNPSISNLSNSSYNSPDIMIFPSTRSLMANTLLSTFRYAKYMLLYTGFFLDRPYRYDVGTGGCYTIGLGIFLSLYGLPYRHSCGSSCICITLFSSDLSLSSLSLSINDDVSVSIVLL